MVEDEFSAQFSSSRVILHLARHGLELFLKASVMAETGDSTLLGHNLAKLFDRYRNIYPGEEFEFSAPPQFAISEETDLFSTEVDCFHSNLDQRHRYTSDRAGKEFSDPEEFNPRRFLEELENLDKQLKTIEFGHVRPKLRRKVNKTATASKRVLD
jgi:hypothetical protein